MRHITRLMVAEVLNTFGTSFDTHEVEERVLRCHTIAFAKELLRYRKHHGKPNPNDPFTTFSAVFSKWIGNTYKGQIDKASTHKVSSDNIGGKLSDNQGWKKTNPNPKVLIT